MGQERIAEQFLQSLARDTLSHVMILLGPEGSGKSTLANYFARALLCTGNNVPCGVCGACVRSASGNHPDLHVVIPSRPGAFRTADAEALQKILSVRPYEGTRRVLILPDAQRMTEEAQNKLLKVLEEPPSDTYIFLLATTLAPFLPTVLSRCAQMNLDRMDRDSMLSYLRRECPEADPVKVSHAVSYSQGWPGRARDLLNNDAYWSARREYADYLLHAHSLQGKLNMCSRFLKNKEDLLSALDTWECMLRDASLHGTKVACLQADLSREIEELATRYKPEELLTLWKAMQEARNALMQNASPGMTLDSLLAAWTV